MINYEGRKPLTANTDTITSTAVKQFYTLMKIKYICTQPNTTNVFIALVVTSFGRYNHHQANAIQNLKRLVILSA